MVIDGRDTKKNKELEKTPFWESNQGIITLALCFLIVGFILYLIAGFTPYE